MRMKMSSAKWRPFCLGLNVLTHYFRCLNAKEANPQSTEAASLVSFALELELELENNLFDKKYINVSTGYYKHTENDTHCRETLTLVQDVPLSREPPGKYK